MQHRTAPHPPHPRRARPHPIAEVLAAQGRTKTWLARRVSEMLGTTVSPQHATMIVFGQRPARPAFRRACALALNLPEGLLFRGEQQAIE
jgi:hypothetical protein